MAKFTVSTGPSRRPLMFDKHQLVVSFAAWPVMKRSDKLKFVGHTLPSRASSSNIARFARDPAGVNSNDDQDGRMD
jgi:hypothetical protein